MSLSTEKHLSPMKVQKVPLVAIERLRLRRRIGIHAHPFKRTNVRHPRDKELAVVVEADEPPIKQVIRTGGHEQPVGALQALVVGAFPPRLDMASDQVRRIIHKRDPAGAFDVRHSFLEEPLADPGLDQGRARSGGEIRVSDSALFDILPFLDASKLTFDEGTGRIMQRVTAEGGRILSR